MKTRSKYHSSIATLYFYQKEHLLPLEFRKNIPYSTASTWRNTNPQSYTGAQFAIIQQQGLEWAELFHQHRNLKKVITLITKVWISLSDMFIPLINTKNYQERIINEMQRLFVAVPKKMVFRISGMSEQTFYYRLHKIVLACNHSPLNLCFKRHPLQLSIPEIKTMVELLKDKQLACWPIDSIAHYARRNDLLFAAVSTWYKYVHLLGLKKMRLKAVEKTIGIITSRPNQFLHVDTTFWTYDNGVKRAIVFVSDNFSKAILGWSFSEFKSAGNVKEALLKAIYTIRKYYPEHLCANLVADGGAENHAITIEQLLRDTEHPEITKVIALKDIAFSNSPVEAIHKIIKRYLREDKPQTDEQLECSIQKAFYDYCFVRPHGSLKGMIPMEVYTRLTPDLNFSSKIAEAKQNRMLHNKKISCGKC